LATIVGDAYATPSRRRTCVSDHDRSDLPDYGTITGLTDRDSSDIGGRGRQTGLTDTDGADRPGRGYGAECPAAQVESQQGPGRRGFSDNDSGPTADRAGSGRGGRAGVTDNDSGPNADRAGAGRPASEGPRGFNEGATSTELGGQVLPTFPWPPPAPTVPAPPLPRALVIGHQPRPTLLYVAQRLTSALARAGYVEFTFYRVPNGFSLISRFEQIQADGKPAPGGARYPPPDGRTPLSFEQYLASLFVAPVGHYRQIVFVATNAPFVANGKSMSADVANQLLRNGANELPATFNRMLFGPDYAMTPLIYEYQKSGRNGPMVHMQTSPLTSQSHLAPILMALSAAR
jgi:hypothetical protein